nr:hypothetical protein [uncultured Mediterraneibacter sp.]
MQYRYEEHGQENKVWKDKKKHNWNCMDQDRFMKVTGGRVAIVADAGVKGKETEDKLTAGKHSIPLYQTRPKLGFFHKITGYIPCTDGGEGGYVRIVGRAAGKIAVLLIILAALIAGGIFLYLSRQEGGPEIDKAAISYEMPEGMVNTDPDSIALPGYSILTLSNSDGIIHSPLINPEGNTCYFVYTISLADSGEVLYESGYIEPGSAIPEFELNRTLEPGTYDIVINAAASDIDDYTQELNGGSIDALLEVEE